MIFDCNRRDRRLYFSGCFSIFPFYLLVATAYPSWFIAEMHWHIGLLFKRDNLIFRRNILLYDRDKWFSLERERPHYLPSKNISGPHTYLREWFQNEMSLQPSDMHKCIVQQVSWYTLHGILSVRCVYMIYVTHTYYADSYTCSLYHYSCRTTHSYMLKLYRKWLFWNQFWACLIWFRNILSVWFGNLFIS